MIHHNPIIEVQSGIAIEDIRSRISHLTTAIGLIVPKDNGLDYRDILCDLPIPCAGIAFVYDKRMGYINRLRLMLELSRYHACPCRIVHHKEDAYIWLEQNLQLDTL